MAAAGSVKAPVGDEPGPTNTAIAGEVVDLANALIRKFGERSTSFANHQALRARASGDELTAAAWRWIAGATVEILRSEPGESPSQPRVRGGDRRRKVR